MWALQSASDNEVIFTLISIRPRHIKIVILMRMYKSGRLMIVIVVEVLMTKYNTIWK